MSLCGGTAFNIGVEGRLMNNKIPFRRGFYCSPFYVRHDAIEVFLSLFNLTNNDLDDQLRGHAFFERPILGYDLTKPIITILLQIFFVI